MRPALIGIYVVLDHSKNGEVNDHDDQCKNPCEPCDSSTDYGSNHSSAAAGEKGDECQGAGNWVEDHGACKTVGGGLGGVTELGA